MDTSMRRLYINHAIVVKSENDEQDLPSQSGIIVASLYKLYVP